MKIKAFIFCFLIIYVGCQKKVNNEEKVTSPKESEVPVLEDPLLPPHPILDFTWVNGNIEILFDPSLEANYEFKNQCIYFFPYSFDDRQKYIEWNIDTLKCKSGFDLSREFAGIKSPGIGEKFADVELESDSVLKFKYLNEVWVNKINETYGQNVFPSRFRKFRSLR